MQLMKTASASGVSTARAIWKAAFGEILRIANLSSSVSPRPRLRDPVTSIPSSSRKPISRLVDVVHVRRRECYARYTERA